MEDANSTADTTINTGNATFLFRSSNKVSHQIETTYDSARNRRDENLVAIQDLLGSLQCTLSEVALLEEEQEVAQARSDNESTLSGILGGPYTKNKNDHLRYHQSTKGDESVQEEIKTHDRKTSNDVSRKRASINKKKRGKKFNLLVHKLKNLVVSFRMKKGKRNTKGLAKRTDNEKETSHETSVTGNDSNSNESEDAYCNFDVWKSEMAQIVHCTPRPVKFEMQSPSAQELVHRYLAPLNKPLLSFGSDLSTSEHRSDFSVDDSLFSSTLSSITGEESLSDAFSDITVRKAIVHQLVS